MTRSLSLGKNWLVLALLASRSAASRGYRWPRRRPFPGTRSDQPVPPHHRRSRPARSLLFRCSRLRTRAAPPPAASARTSGAAGSASSGADLDEPALLAADGSPLPQTDARPSASDERFKRRMQRVADAIITGDVEKARSSFFPLVAYAQVKDVQKPERDYRYRLMAHFERDVREYHKALGRDAEHAELLGVDVPEARVEWMKPGKEGNRLGYFRVLRSKLRFRLPDGKERSFELTSLISWRGEWYVVHLHGFE